MPELHQLCERMTIVEDTIDHHHKRITDLHDSLAENTRMTRESLEVAQKSIEINQATADNTAELVELFKGAKAFRKFALWVVGLGAPLYAIYEALRFLK